MRRQLHACGAAFTLLTRLPVYGSAVHDADNLARAATYFPLVGAVVGLLGGLVFAAAAYLWQTPLAVILSIAATVLVTGAFHEDALADALDGFGGGWNRTQVLAIMKDSRVGSYALVGVVLVLAAKFVALTTIATPRLEASLIADPERGVGAFVRAVTVAHVLARWSSVPLIWRYPYVRPETKGERPSAGRPLGGAVTLPRFAAATLFALVVIVVALGARALPVAAVAVGVTWIAGWYVDRRLGGITGDALGAANQLVELSVYLALAVR
ncbi:MAG: adenosylcobinamide-GDP ribazoletransferase [bacterium]